MSDDAAEKKDDGYLPVLRMWARTEFLKQCSYVANAETQVEKEERIEALKKMAPQLTAIMLGVDLVNDACAVCVDDRIAELEAQLSDLFEQLDERTGQLGVARDLFMAVLQCPTLTEDHKAAMHEWLADVEESNGWENEGEREDDAETN